MKKFTSMLLVVVLSLGLNIPCYAAVNPSMIAEDLSFDKLPMEAYDEEMSTLQEEMVKYLTDSDMSTCLYTHIYPYEEGFTTQLFLTQKDFSLDCDTSGITQFTGFLKADSYDTFVEAFAKDSLSSIVEFLMPISISEEEKEAFMQKIQRENLPVSWSIQSVNKDYFILEIAFNKYVISEGDTLTSIAEKFNVSVDQLVALNGIADPDLIYVNDFLIIH